MLLVGAVVSLKAQLQGKLLPVSITQPLSDLNSSLAIWETALPNHLTLSINKLSHPWHDNSLSSREIMRKEGRRREEKERGKKGR